MKRIAIVEDEAHVRQFMRTSLELLPNVEICGEADSVQGAYQMILQAKPHAVILDVSLRDGTGFELLDKFPKLDFKVIFSTAFDEFALKAFRYNALDYILKPVSQKELYAALDRLNTEGMEAFTQKIKNVLVNSSNHDFTQITLSTQEGLVFLNLNEIVYIQSEGNYTTFFLQNKERHLVAKGMKEYEEILPSNIFFRVHQSHIVNRRFIKKVLKEDGDMVMMEGGDKLPLALRRKQEFLNWAMKPA